MQIVRSTGHTFDLQKLREDVNRVIAMCPFFDETNQISLRHRPQTSGADIVTRFRDGVGQLKNYDSNGRAALEADFSVLHELVADSYLGEVIRFVEHHFPRAQGRYRIRRLNPGVCLPWHSDDLIKYHVPVDTSPGCFFITQHGIHGMPREGELYIVRTDVHHSAMNGSKKPRIHLAIDTTRASRAQYVIPRSQRLLSRILSKAFGRT